MDKRKLQRGGLHKNLNPLTASQSSSVTDPEDVFLSSASRSAITSQRESNTDLLRKQVDSFLQPLATSSQNTKANPSDQITNSKRPFTDHISPVQSPKKTRLISQPVPGNEEKKLMGGSLFDAVDGPPNARPIRSQIADVQINSQRDIGRNSKNFLPESSTNKRVDRRSIFSSFLYEAGVIEDDKNDDSYMIKEDPLVIAKKMRQLLGSGDFNTDEIIQEWESNLLPNMERFEQCLNPTNIVSHDDGGRSESASMAMRHTKSMSLVKILLQVPELQTRILNSLIQKLNETVVAADNMGEVPWTYQLLQQLRFIEAINDAELLTLKLEELLETSPVWFQRELIVFLPDIVVDAQHENIAGILYRLMEVHSDLTNVILDCITNLSLGKESQEELREKMLKMLQNSCHINKIPAIIRFCLAECTSIDSCQNVLRAIRSLELQPLDGENFDEYYTNQMLIVNAVKMSVMLTSDMANAAALVAGSTTDNPKPFDIILLLLLYDGTIKKKRADAILKQHVKSGYYNATLLNDFYNNFRQVIIDVQSIALRMASNLLKLEDRILRDFASEWLRQQFIAHGHLIHKQREIVEKLILLMGNNDQTAKSALAILCKMTKNDEEKRYLQAHCNHLRIIMEKVEKFHLEEVMILNDLLHALCSNASTISHALRDDLFILLQKQLSCRGDSMTKCKGVAGAVMAIKHLATNSAGCDTAKKIFQKVLNGVKDCPRSQGFFYDKIGLVINDTPNINDEFLKFIADIIEEQFINTYMTDMASYSGEMQPTFGLNNSESDPKEDCVVQFGISKYGGAIVPALLRLMGICFMRIDDNGNVENISALLGCAVIMPKDLDLPDAYTLDHLFHCINWFRELVNIFVTQSDPISQKQVSQRLDHIIDLQSELSNLLTLAEARYQSPSCYFDCCPSELPPLKLMEKKIVKKGKRAAPGGMTTGTEKSGGGNILEHREPWEIATLLSTKNIMYFRRLDARVLNLIDIKVTHSIPELPSQSLTLSSSSSPPPAPRVRNEERGISTSQLCFIIKELLAVFEDEAVADEKFVQDLIVALPKICNKLQEIVDKLGFEETENCSDDSDSNQNKQAVRLIFVFLAAIFRWKQFNNPLHKIMLRDALRILAGQIDKSNATHGSCKKLVGESYKYFESLAHVATQISIAYALVDVCKTLMKHSETFTRQHQDKQAKMAYGFLCLEWPDDRHTGTLYKSAVIGLLKNWMDHEQNPLETVTSVMEWLPNEVTKMEKPHDKLTQLPTINRLNFHSFISKIFDGLIRGIKISLLSASTDVRRLEVWRKVAENIQAIVSVCKKMVSKNTLLVYMRFMPLVLKQFLTIGMPVFERNLRFQTEEVISILKMMQVGTRYLNAVCVHSTEKKDLALTKLVPTAKTTLERIIYSVKGMLVLNNSSTAFWMGNLVNKNLDGQEIISQTSDSTDAEHASVLDVRTSDDTGDSTTRHDEGSLSDLLESDDDNVEDGEGEISNGVIDDDED